MKKLSFLIITIMLSVMACQDAPVVVDMDAEKAAIAELFTTFIAAIEGQDIETMASLLCDDALICGTDPSEFWNKEQILEEWKKMFTIDPVKLNYFGDRIIMINPDGNSAYSIDQFYFSFYTPEVAWRTVYNLIKVEGKWKVNMWSNALIPKNKDLATIAKAVSATEEPIE